MKPKTTILMVLAIGCGLAAAFMTNKLIAERNKPVEEVEKVTVLVAKKKIPAMTFIKKPDDFFEAQEKSKNDVPKNIMSDLTDKDIKDGFRVSRTFSEGNFLTRDDLISKDMEGLAAKVPPGMRAVAIRVTAETLAGGFVLPNSKVDVVWTFRTTNNLSGCLTILQNMLVLAVDTQSGRNPDNPQTILGATVTLAVKPEDAQKLALAKANGEICLSLRPVGDEQKLLINGATPIDLAKMFSDGGETKPEESSESGTGTTTIAAVPPIPPVTPTTPTKEPAAPVTEKDPPAVTKTEEKPVKPVKIHTLLVLDGGAAPRKFEYVYDEDKHTYEGSVKRTEIDPKP